MESMLDEKNHRPTPPPPHKQKARLMPAPKRHILVIEDDERLRDLLLRFC